MQIKVRQTLQDLHFSVFLLALGLYHDVLGKYKQARLPQTNASQ